MAKLRPQQNYVNSKQTNKIELFLLNMLFMGKVQKIGKSANNFSNCLIEPSNKSIKTYDVKESFIVIDIRISANCGVPKAFQRNQVPNITVVEVRIAKKSTYYFQQSCWKKKKIIQ